MAQAVTRPKLTFEEYIELPYDGRRIELVNGELVELTPPRETHHRIQDFLCEVLRDRAREQGLDWRVFASGRGVRIAEDTSYIPDVIMATPKQLDELEFTGKASIFPIGNPPFLVAEIVSSGRTKKDTEEKLAGYAIAKVPEYWIINPLPRGKSVSVYVLQGDTYILKGKFKGNQPIESNLLTELNITAAEVLERQ